jgi:hypothetical protein
MAIKKNISANQTHLSPRNDGCRQPVAKLGAAARRVEVCSQHQTPHRQRRICTVTAQAISAINPSEVVHLSLLDINVANYSHSQADPILHSSTESTNQQIPPTPSPQRF